MVFSGGKLYEVKPVKKDSLLTLKKKISQCEICIEHLPLGVNPVLRGTSRAKILIAGQAPGTKVHQTSIPFNDPSGIRLREWMGVSDEVFYDDNLVAIIPMGFCYPGKGKSGDLPPRPECAKNWHQQLLDKMVNIELILAIGQYAQNYYLKDLKKRNLTETVKSWQEYSPLIIPLPHPSPRNNIWLKKNDWFEKSVLKALKIRVSQILSSE